MKNNFLKTKQKLMRRVGLVYSFKNLLNIWLNRRKLDFPICSCIQSVAISHVLQHLENSTIHCENESEKGK